MSLIDGPTIPQLARKLGVPRSTMWRRLLAMHGRDRESDGEAFVPWLYRYGVGGRWRVNLSRLRRKHPEVFDVATNEELDHRLKIVERHVERLDTSLRRVRTRLQI